MNSRKQDRRMIALAAAAGLIAAAGAAALAYAAETVTYSYDARGRVVKAARTGTVNNGVTATYAHDKADNRTNRTVTGAP